MSCGLCTSVSLPWRRSNILGFSVIVVGVCVFAFFEKSIDLYKDGYMFILGWIGNRKISLSKNDNVFCMSCFSFSSYVLT